ncbi:MAG: HAD family hydrolase [Fibrobacterota bacterium]
MITHILCDNDGVLVDTEYYYFRASAEILSRAGCILTQQKFIQISHVEGKGVWDAFPGFSTEEKQTLREERNLLYNSYLRENDLTVPGAEETMKNLSHHYTMAIVTSALPRDFLTIHKKTRFLPLFEFYLASGDYEASKPAAAPYKTAMEKFSVAPRCCVVVEDTLRGVRSGNSAGATTIAIPNPMANTHDFYEADHCIDDIRMLPGLLETL